jgi:hypothetical protein
MEAVVSPSVKEEEVHQNSKRREGGTHQCRCGREFGRIHPLFVDSKVSFFSFERKKKWCLVHPPVIHISVIMPPPSHWCWKIVCSVVLSENEFFKNDPNETKTNK